MATSRVLPDHKHFKKKLIAPMNYVLQDAGWTVEKRWVNHERAIVPEILWLRYLDANLGGIRASHVISRILVLSKGLSGTKWVSGYVSSFRRLDSSSINQLRDLLDRDDTLKDLRTALSDLAHLFEDFPLNPILRPLPVFEVGATERLKENMRLLNDRESRETIVSLAHLFFGTVITGRLTFGREFTPPRMQDVLDYPQTDDSQIAASTLRAMSKSIDPAITYGDEEGWQAAFWKTCLKIEPCQI